MRRLERGSEPSFSRRIPNCTCFVVGVHIISNIDNLSYVFCSETTYLKKKNIFMELGITNLWMLECCDVGLWN